MGSNTAGSAGIRLTRRGRVVLVGLAAVLAVGVGSVADQAQASRPADPARYETVYVAAGDTLWGIADSIAADRDVRDVVAELVDLNDLASTELTVGQTLEVPVEVPVAVQVEG